MSALTHIEGQISIPQKTVETSIAPEESQWKPLYRLAAGAAILTLLIIPAQVVIYMAHTPPETVMEWFSLFESNPLQGLLSLDFIYLINQALMVPVLLALFVILRKTSPSLALFGLGLGLFGLAIHTTSNPSIDMLLLSQEYANATNDVVRTSLLATGELLLIKWVGTAYAFGYVVVAVALGTMSVVMWQSAEFGRWIAGSGVVMALTWMIPPTFGTIGLIFSFLSIIPTFVWLALLTRHFLQLAQTTLEDES